MSDYQQFLNDLHAKTETPESFISAAVFEAVGQHYVQQDLQRIIAGEANEVYRVYLNDDREVIVRISKKVNDFKQEKWAIDQCEKVGVPVPKVLLIKNLDDIQKSICVQEKLPGEPLERGGINMSSLSRDELKGYIVQAGNILSHIHSISTSGFGELNDQGEGSAKHFKDMMAEHIGQEELYAPLANKYGLDPVKLRRAFEILESQNETLPDVSPVLNHGDYGPKHIMVDRSIGKVTGILDFGEVNGNSPVSDLARWAYWFEEQAPLAWLKEGYSDKSVFANDFERLYHLTRLHNALGAMWYYYDVDYMKGVHGVFRRMLSDIDYFE